MTTGLLTLALVLTAADRDEFQEFTSKVIHIADGDTLTVLDSDKVEHRVRLHGIDAPEKGQAFGTKSREALAEKVHEQMVRVIWKDRDRYGRIVGDVYLGNRNINIEQVREGWAWWYRSYAPKSGTLERNEAEARSEHRGLWHDKNPEPPWEYRRKERDRERKQPRKAA